MDSYANARHVIQVNFVKIKINAVIIHAKMVANA